ncbi:NAD(P)-dependent dehydrogenase, short-chain alcohol dehydrogenase family [Nocardia amikacinitolerans]|uniref:NAD(P)-dependent dehydrogenase, short-chain alcohol dehydrogenase family n=1 Tax=Nocardia amikacinitolerans TaxID=756689 RepID=A0A285L9D1_9NOCA|nr:oxidoreductase [Nocardia amikacinitolerans]MCP2280337.1 NAD(P)-dependent dehydrogenase, short-chain alcohol dehydrogenase family [Nocardia amikacinitolerans]MCP2299997.1 NAD(P)-dependent dehydrogenase, short-chain alcohol dehydrogenase family [Nocardia amikacinitolerans]SNY81559.1 NAD(P)-dependent dehydrogenase, short-chain alcohol dehydrogenase family [Nocardia amikacinitolerans]
MAWKPTELPDQTGRTFVITGANGGLGAETTKVLAAKGATVVMACRNAAKAEEVAAAIPGDVRVAKLDLADLSSVRAFAKQSGEIDVLVNNAGLMNIPFSRTADGFETQFGVNHLGHFALTGLLLDRIRDRVVTLASIAHKQTPKLWIDDLNYENRRYQRNLAYAQAKLSNLMFARELQRRLAESGSKKRSYAVHPGVSATDLFARTETPLDKVSKPFIRLIGHSPAKAAHSTLFAAGMPDPDPDVYWGPTRLFGSQGPVQPSSSTRLSKNPELQRRLWEESERMTGVTYKF